MNNIELIQHYFTLSNKGDIDAISLILDTDVSYSSDNVGLHFGKDNILEMKRRFFGGLKSQKWEIHKIKEISDNIFKITFLFIAETQENETISREGVENIIVHNGKLRHIEVRNI